MCNNKYSNKVMLEKSMSTKEFNKEENMSKMKTKLIVM